MTEDASDEILISKAKVGDESAFRILITRYESVVAATVKRMITDEDEADDVGQETFIRFYQSIQDFRGESSLKTFLVRIAMNCSLNALRKKRREALWKMPLILFKESIAVNRDFENQDSLERAMNKLTPEHRAVVVLRLMQDYTTEETAQLLQIPIGTVLSRLARAQEKLRQILTTDS